MSNLQVKVLAKETAIYGVSSIVGKFLNWMLVPLYTYVLNNNQITVLLLIYMLGRLFF